MNQIGEELYQIAGEIFPICRSLTGNGVRETFEILKKYIHGLEIFEIPSGKKVFDWVVPNEWNIREAYIEDSKGQRIIDFHKNNLHVMGYSIPVDKWVDLSELEQYLYTEPLQPEVIPYVTSYYKERCGFCMSQKQKESLIPGNYHMVIDSELKPGNLTYAELFLKGNTDDEIILSTYICHPSMANNECSGPALAAGLSSWIRQSNRRYSYRILFLPETIGAISYLHDHLTHMKQHVKAGFVLTCVGDNLNYSMVQSRYEDTLADRVLRNTLRFQSKEAKIYSFLDRGSDERQFGSPLVDLPFVTFCRSKFHTFDEYHTSADNMGFISPEGLLGSYQLMCSCLETLENNYYYRIKVYCEPQLGKRGLYPTVSQKGSYSNIKAITDFIAYADGKNDLITISEIISVSPTKLVPIIQILKENELLEVVNK